LSGFRSSCKSSRQQRAARASPFDGSPAGVRDPDANDLDRLAAGFHALAFFVDEAGN